MSRDPAPPASGISEEPVIPPAAALVAAVVAISWAAPLIRFAVAPALAIAAWRLVFSELFVGGVVAARGSILRGVRLSGREWVLAGAAGLFLAAHFWSWIASVRLTTVASSVVLVSTYPFWVAGLSIAFLGERPRLREWIGIGVATVGAFVIGWGDLALGPDALLGDGLALLGALCVAAYFTIGRSLRRRLDLWAYVALVYGSAAVALVAGAALNPGVALVGYPTTDWLVFLGLAAGPMMIGHTGVNYALRYMPAYVANLPLLIEPVGATLIAWALPGIREVPPARTLIGGVVVLVGIAVATLPGGRGRGEDVGRRDAARTEGRREPPERSGREP